MRSHRVLPFAALAAALVVSGAASAQPAPDTPALAPTPIAEPSPGELTLNEVVKLTEERFPLIVAAARDQDVAEADLLSARGGFDPTWRTTAASIVTGAYPYHRVDSLFEQPTPAWGTTLFAGYRYGTGKVPVYDGKIETNDYGEVRGGVIVPVWRNGPIDRRRAGVARARIGIDVAGLSVVQQRIEITRQASLRYWDWVTAGLRVNVARDVLKLAVDRDAALGVRVERGDVPLFERNENLRAILQREGDIVRADRALTQAAIELSLFLRGADGSPRMPDATRMPHALPPVHPVNMAKERADERAALARRPEVRRLELQEEQTHIDRDLAENQRKPGIDLFIVGSKDLGPGDPARALPVVEGGVVVEFPILARVASGRVAAAEAGLEKLQAQARFARDRVVADVRDAANAMETARLRVGVAAREVVVAKQLAEQELRRFNLGDSTLLLVNLREQSTADAAVREIDALAEYHKAVAQYRAATAGLGP